MRLLTTGQARKRQRKHTVDMLSPQPASKRGRCKGDPRVLCWATSPLQSENSQAAEPLIQGAVFITVFAPIHPGKNGVESVHDRVYFSYGLRVSTRHARKP